MRRANNHNKLMDGETFIGFNLGADFTSEHEWGIKDMRSMFGMKDDKMGIDRRTATVFPEDSIFFYAGKNYAVLICERDISSEWGSGKYLRSPKFKRDLKTGHLSGMQLGIFKPYIHPEDKDKEEVTDLLGTSWDSKSFGIMVTSESSDNLKSLYEAIKKQDVSIWQGGGGVFENAGLVVAIRSLLPADGLKTMKDADEDAKRLHKADLKTGVKKKLEKAGKRYFACAPKWINEFSSKDHKSEHDVIYWLNPMEQNKNNYGWFTVEELEEWAEGKGKVMMEITA